MSVDGEEILTIEPNMLTGVADIDKYDDEILQCARHLLGFIGRGYEE